MERSVEAFIVAILPWLPEFDEEGADAEAAEPIAHRLGDETRGDSTSKSARRRRPCAPAKLSSREAGARKQTALRNGRDKNDPNDPAHAADRRRSVLSRPLACGINDVQDLSKTHEMIAGDD